ncbi:hypothetical protein Acr_13g0016230 [Actinidia rufa]|uniref:Uncharacterized protein n=1 Tax=Actinidia rufa TaxID=165716 RepID=A0A7J0FNR1_9ERIC|nr:hypothetical protein Acr_13g0016230 [Actinidia rufa]
MVRKRKAEGDQEAKENNFGNMGWDQMMNEAAANAIALGEAQRARKSYIRVHQRPSGRWVAEINDTIQKIRVWITSLLLHRLKARNNASPTMPNSLDANSQQSQEAGENEIVESQFDHFFDFDTTNINPTTCESIKSIEKGGEVSEIEVPEENWTSVDLLLNEEMVEPVEKENYGEEELPSMVTEAMKRMKYERTFSASLYAFNGLSECLKLKLGLGNLSKLRHNSSEDQEKE